jgi:uncharacterized protein with PIN domain
MDTADFRFYAYLNDFLPASKRHRSNTHPAFDGTQTVKHLIEAQGIPHTEVDLILVDGTAVGFEHQVRPSEQISIYPAFTTLNTAPLLQLRPPPPEPARFLLDNHLGRLARYLRLLGFDTLYFNNRLDDEQLADLSCAEERVLLSRDRGLLKRKQVIHGHCLRTKDPREQLKAVILRYRLAEQIRLWSRCLRCNGDLHRVPKTAVMDRLEPKTKLYFEEFQQCQSCAQVYWQGSHYTQIRAFLEQFFAELA